MDDDLFDDLMRDDHMSDEDLISSEHSDYGLPPPTTSGTSSQIIQPPKHNRLTDCRLDTSWMPRCHGPGIKSGAVIVKLEDMLENIIDCMLEEKPVVIRLKSRCTNGQQVLDSVTGVLRTIGTVKAKEVRFPGKTQSEAWKFAALFSIISLSHEALVTGVVTTKRDIYYKDPSLFINQSVVDRYIDDLAYTLNISRHQLNVVATAKGLTHGPLGVLTNCGAILDCSSDTDGILVPDIREIKEIYFRGLKWILVIEKEATFRTLCRIQYSSSLNSAPHSATGQGLLITAKGYPDISTRAFIHYLSNLPLCPQIFCLTDCDPHGLSILSTYAVGSVALAHENVHLAVPTIKWLGVRLHDVLSTQGQCDHSEEDGDEETEVAGVLALTKRDRKLATNMLASNPAFAEDTNAEWRREVQCILFLNVKAEIQILGGGQKLGGWVEKRIMECQK